MGVSMRRDFNRLIRIMVGMICVLGILGCANENKDVSSEQTRPGQTIQEGLTGRVVDSKGQAVEGAFIQPRSLDKPSPPIPEIAILSDSSGQYMWPLRPGNYEITVSADGYVSATGQVKVRAGAVTTLDFTLNPK